MNYRHVYHAGNFADVFKHALLARVLVYLARKDALLRYLDTHAGAGMYRVTADEARRTGEWRGGAGLLIDAAPPDAVRDLLSPYIKAAGLASADARALYPGSPVQAQRLLRAQDRLVLCELHEADAKSLGKAIGRDRRVKALNMDGYMALNAFVPPPERRGLVLVDPPFEEPDEFPRLSTALAGAWAKWRTGTFMAWYPRKDLPAVGAFKASLVRDGLRRVLCLELDVEAPSEGPLAGSGLVVINPPHVLEEEARAILPFLTALMARGRGAAWRVDWLAGE